MAFANCKSAYEGMLRQKARSLTKTTRRPANLSTYLCSLNCDLHVLDLLEACVGTIGYLVGDSSDERSVKEKYWK